MTKVRINPGVCGLITTVCAMSDDQETVTLKIDSACPAVNGIIAALGCEFDAYDICLRKPGTGPLYDYAGKHFPGHCACPTIAGITKCIEAECRLALKRNASIEFIDD